MLSFLLLFSMYQIKLSQLVSINVTKLSGNKTITSSNICIPEIIGHKHSMVERERKLNPRFLTRAFCKVCEKGNNLIEITDLKSIHAFMKTGIYHVNGELF